MRILSTMALLTLALGQLSACSCMAVGSPCHSAGQSTAVFIGKVLAFTKSAEHVSDSTIGAICSPRRSSRSWSAVRVRVLDVLSGIQPTQTEVELVSDGLCGYEFRRGATYVIYANAGPAGRLLAGICSRTGPLEQAQEDVAYFRKMAQKPSTGKHRVLTDTPGVTILAEGQGSRHSVQTDGAGDATFPPLPPGEYSIHQESDGNLPSDPKVRVNAKGCIDMTLLRFLELAGRVTTADGGPASRIEVELVSSSGREASTVTDENGRYDLRIARPGTYQFGVNLTHAPTRETPYPRYQASAAASIEFTGRAESRIVDFILPERVKERILEGFASMADGRTGPLIELVVMDSSGEMVA